MIHLILIEQLRRRDQQRFQSIYNRGGRLGLRLHLPATSCTWIAQDQRCCPTTDSLTGMDCTGDDLEAMRIPAEWRSSHLVNLENSTDFDVCWRLVSPWLLRRNGRTYQVSVHVGQKCPYSLADGVGYDTD